MFFGIVFSAILNNFLWWMQATVQFRPHNRDLGVVVREVDEDLAIFLGMKNGEEKEITLCSYLPFHFLAFLISMLILGKIEFDDNCMKLYVQVCWNFILDFTRFVALSSYSCFVYSSHFRRGGETKWIGRRGLSHFGL